MLFSLEDYFYTSLLFQNELGANCSIAFTTDTKYFSKNKENYTIIHQQNKNNSVQKNDQNLTIIEQKIVGNSIQDIKKELQYCKCTLKNGINTTIIGDGIESAKVLLIGEGPGEEEDKMGIPFCGRSGKLLEQALASIGLSRNKNLYITNTVFWRPPNNRKPDKDELLSCRPYLDKIIEIINPKFIILCGSTAALEFLQKEEKMSNIIGKIFDYKNKNEIIIKCMPIYHPSYMLRNPISKKTVWENLIDIKRYLDKNIENWMLS